MKQNTSNEAITYMAPEFYVLQISVEQGFAMSIDELPNYVDGFGF